jgi:hypothetical protein
LEHARMPQHDVDRAVAAWNPKISDVVAAASANIAPPKTGLPLGRGRPCSLPAFAPVYRRAQGSPEHRHPWRYKRLTRFHSCRRHQTAWCHTLPSSSFPRRPTVPPRQRRMWRRGSHRGSRVPWRPWEFRFARPGNLDFARLTGPSRAETLGQVMDQLAHRQRRCPREPLLRQPLQNVSAKPQPFALCPPIRN